MVESRSVTDQGTSKKYGIVEVIGSSSGDLYKYVAEITVLQQAEMQSDFVDITFYDNDTGQQLNFYHKGSGVFDVQIPYLKQAPNVKQIKYTYGGTSVHLSNSATTYSFFDNFEDGNITGWTNKGGTTQITTTYQISGLYSLQHIGAGGTTGVHNDLATFNYTKIPNVTEFDFKFNSSGTATYEPYAFLYVLRYVDATNWLRVDTYWTGSAQIIRLLQMSAGTPTVLLGENTLNTTKWGMGATHHFRIEDTGQYLKVFMDDVLVLQGAYLSIVPPAAKGVGCCLSANCSWDNIALSPIYHYVDDFEDGLSTSGRSTKYQNWTIRAGNADALALGMNGNACLEHVGPGNGAGVLTQSGSTVGTITTFTFQNAYGGTKTYDPYFNLLYLRYVDGSHYLRLDIFWDGSSKTYIRLLKNEGSGTVTVGQAQFGTVKLPTNGIWPFQVIDTGARVIVFVNNTNKILDTTYSTTVATGTWGLGANDDCLGYWDDITKTKLTLDAPFVASRTWSDTFNQADLSAFGNEWTIKESIMGDFMILNNSASVYAESGYNAQWTTGYTTGVLLHRSLPEDGNFQVTVKLVSEVTDTSKAFGLFVMADEQNAYRIEQISTGVQFSKLIAGTETYDTAFDAGTSQGCYFRIERQNGHYFFMGSPDGVYFTIIKIIWAWDAIIPTRVGISARNWGTFPQLENSFDNFLMYTDDQDQSLYTPEAVIPNIHYPHLITETGTGTEQTFATLNLTQTDTLTANDVPTTLEVDWQQIARTDADTGDIIFEKIEYNPLKFPVIKPRVDVVTEEVEDFEEPVER